MPSPRISAARKYAILTRHRPEGDPEIAEAKREHAVASIEECVQKTLAASPPLHSAQLQRLRDLFAADA